MKKISIMIIAIALMVNTGYGQEANVTDLRERVSIGGKVGLNVSNAYDSEGEDFDSKPKAGFAVGGFLSIPIGIYLGIQPEIMFSQRGFIGTGTVQGVEYKVRRTTNNLDIPLLVAFKPGEFFTFLLGPQYSYLVSQSDLYKNGSGNIEQETDFRNDNVRRNIFCMTGGVDFTMKHFVLGTRGGIELQNNNGDGTSTNPRYKGVWLQGSIGYRFYSSK